MRLKLLLVRSVGQNQRTTASGPFNNFYYRAYWSKPFTLVEWLVAILQAAHGVQVHVRSSVARLLNKMNIYQLAKEAFEVEEKEEKLVHETVKHLTEANVQISYLSEEFSVKSDESRKQKEEITHLLAQVIHAILLLPTDGALMFPSHLFRSAISSQSRSNSPRRTMSSAARSRY